MQEVTNPQQGNPALENAYKLAQSKGYKKDINSFKTLISSDEAALNNIYYEVKNKGYKKDINSFKELVGVTSLKKKDGTKPNSTSTSVSPKQDSVQKSGSSGSQEFEYKPVYDERGREVKIKNAKGELVPYMEKVPKGFASSTEEREVIRQEQKQKASKPIVTSSNLKKYQEATKVNEEEKALLQQEVNDEFDKKGFWNGISDGAKKGFNFLADTFTAIGTFGTETEASKNFKMETDSFAKEKKQAEQELIASKQPVTPEAIAEKAKQIKLKKKIDGLVVDKNNEFLSNLSEKEIKSLNLERVKQYKTLSDKDKYIATQLEILKNTVERDTKDYATADDIIKKNKEKGIETNQSLIDFSIEKENSLKEKRTQEKELEAEYISNKENIGSAEEEVDFLKRIYDTADKIKTLAKIGFGDIYNSLANKLPLMVDDLDQAIFEPLRPGSSEGVLSDDERQQLIDNSIDWENAKELAKSKVKKDVDFENLSLSNFGQFFAQEIGTQLPIFAQMAMPGGIVSIGMTSAFDKYGKMEQESNNISFEFNGKQYYGFEKENGEIVDSLGNTYDPKEVNILSLREADKSTANKFFTSVTFGTAEAVLGAMPTKNIFGRALSSFSTSGERTLFRQSVKEFVKAKGTSVLNDTATEVVSEGATQIIQNIADISSGNKNIGIYDGVDHAAVSAGMLSFFMSAIPAVAGLALKPFSESKENKQVNENLQEIFALQSQLNNTEISDISKTTIQNRINELEKANSEVLDKIASRTKGISKETFDAIKDVNKKQELLILQASEISKDNSLDKDVKKKIIADLESQFNNLETKRNKLASGKSTILDALSDNESARLKEKAANVLVNEEKAKGKTDEEINFTEEEINKKAIEIYKQNAVQQEATITEAKQEAQPQAETQTEVAEVSNAILELEKQRDAEIEALKDKRLYDKKYIDPIREKYKKLILEQKSKETESKIKNKTLFSDGGLFANELGGSGVNSIPTNHSEINGIEFIQFSNPNTGDVDVIMTGTSDSDFVGYYRIYENGKPTNKWSSKFENQSRNKENFKTMISGVQNMLPENHEYTEKTSISTDGLRVWNQQLSKGYELQYDNNGNLITNEVAINGDAIVNDLGINVEQGTFNNISVTNKEQFENVKKALIPYLKKFGLNENNIKWSNGTVFIDLPVLKKSNQNEKTQGENIIDDGGVSTRVEPSGTTEQEVLETPIVENETAPSNTSTSDGNIQPGNNVVEPSGTTEQENNQAGDVQASDNSRNIEKEKIGTGEGAQAFTTRAFNAENISGRTRDKLEGLGLNYDVESQAKAQENAETIIAELGIIDAYNLAKEGKIRGGARTWIMAQMFEDLNNQINEASEKGETDLVEYLSDELSKIMKEFANEKTLTGQETAMLNRIYNKFGMKYDLEFARENWKKRFGNEIPVEVEAKLKKAEAEIKEYEKQVKELEERIGTLEEQDAMDNLKDVVELNAKNDNGTNQKTYTQEELENEIAEAKKDFESSNIGFEIKPSKTKLKQEEVLLKIQQIKDKWKSAGNDNQLMVSLPYAKQLAKVTPDIIELAKLYSQIGGLKTIDIFNNIKEAFDWIKDNDLKTILKKEFGNKKRVMSPETKRKIYISLLNKRINYLDEQIEKGKREVKSRTDAYATDEEINNLREIKNAKEEELSKIDPKFSERRKLEVALNNAQKSLDEYQRKIDELDFETKAKQEKFIDVNLRNLRNKRDAKKKEFDSAKRAYDKSIISEDEVLAKQINSREKQLEKRIEDVKSGKQNTTSNNALWSPKISELESELKELRDAKKKVKSTKTIKLKEVEQGAIKIPSDLIYSLVKSGIDNISDLTQAVHDAISEEYPNLTLREVRDAITGYGKQVAETKDDIKKEIRRLKTDGKQMSALYDLAEGNRPKRSGRKAKEYTLEQRNRIKKIRELLKKLPIDDTLINEIVARKEKSLRELELKIESVKLEGKELSIKERRKVTYPKIDDLNKQIEEKRNELNDALEVAGIAESKRLDRAIKYSKRRLKELNEKIANGDFTRRKPKTYKYNRELIELKGKILVAKTKWDIEFEKQEFRKLGYSEKLLEYVYRLFGTVKGLKATFDLSAMLRQGVVLGSRNPKEYAKASVEMHKFAFDSKYYKDWMTELETSDDYIYIVEDGLSITNTSGDVLKSEEQFVGNLLSTEVKVGGVNVNLVGRITDGSERAYGGFLNSLRVSVYRKIAKQYEVMGITRQEHPKKFKNIAKFVNNSTGRGVMTSDKRIAKALNIVFFSPRMITGMAGVVKDLVRSESTPYLRKQAATSLLSFMAYQFVMKMLIKQALILVGSLSDDDDDDEITMDMNPVSTDFNKVRKGDKRYDVSSGYGIGVRTASRFILNETSKGIGEENKSFNDVYGKNRFNEVGSFFVNKLSPLSSQIYKYGIGEHPTEFKGKREDATVMDYTSALLIPISVTDLIENVQNDTPEGQMFLDLMLNTYGVSVQNYGDNKKSKNNKD